MLKKVNVIDFKTTVVKKQFLKVLNLVFKLNVTSERTWVLIVTLPAILSFISLYCFSRYSTLHRMLPPQIVCLMLTSPLLTGFIFSLNIIEWRQTYMLRRLKTIGVKPWQILTSSLLVACIFLTISLLVNFLVSYLLAKTTPEIEFSNLSNLTSYVWIWFIITSVLMMMMFFFLTSFLCNFINKKTLGLSFCYLH
ncbi:hypothetical protein SCLARK_00913 [Spiroplasma clarkii]|uniref:hypothetical protein n=1 Tax=Spiroplasma clarkii TaxID=2139 RepID=UPI000B568A81|nr:hypothetical protein [Spiroplasma clarkii]ARU91521.1 hypothetical protein SCLARK_00913 [Spiroplasma clarkii]